MQQVHVLRRQFEVVDVGVLLNPRVCHGLGQRHKPLQNESINKPCTVVGGSHLLQTPPHQNLRRCLSILLHQRLQSLLLESLASHKRTVGFDDHALLLAPLDNVGPRKPRMQFPLPDTDLSTLTLSMLSFEFFDVRLQLVEMMNAVVGDADGADESGAFCFDKSEPGAIAGCGAAVWGMD